MSKTIIEVANTHGGDIDYVFELIDTFSSFKGHYGMKFQPLHPDKIATEDYEWYPVYQELLFEPEEWKQILLKAKATKDIWLDLFDDYGIQILKENIGLIDGIKLQVSVLFNLSIIKALEKIDLKGKKLILNVAALELEEIQAFLSSFEENLNPDEILLEVGFQGYPTQLQDSGISKISIIKSTFQKRIVFADHVEGTSEYAVWLPVIAMASGADIIEKHVMLTTRATKYDAYSSIDVNAFQKMVELTRNYTNLSSATFINEREQLYLERSIMKPLLKTKVNKGQTLSMERDFEFKRSDKSGLNVKQIQELLLENHILSVDKNQGEAIQETDLKKANIAVIIACRLKSSRLKQKAILPIGDLSSVSYCIRNACKFKNVNHVVLATSTLEEDAPLAEHTFNDHVIFHKGDPEDVIQRYLDICRQLKIDIVVRVTADMPFIDDEICQLLLKAHFESGADYTAVKKAAVGTNLEIINVAALEKVKSHFPDAKYSEYMSWYFMNNQNYFNINLVDLPPDLIRDYRLTLDYDADLQLFNQIHNALSSKKPAFNLRDIFQFLDQNPEIAAINSHIKLKYKTDQELIKTLNEKTKISL